MYNKTMMPQRARTLLRRTSLTLQVITRMICKILMAILKSMVRMTSLRPSWIVTIH